MSLDIKKDLSAPFVASKAGKLPMQLFDQEVSSITNNLKIYLFHTERQFFLSISHLFPPYSKCVCKTLWMGRSR